jgi:hypothetical protein
VSGDEAIELAQDSGVEAEACAPSPVSPLTMTQAQHVLPGLSADAPSNREGAVSRGQLPNFKFETLA